MVQATLLDSAHVSYLVMSLLGFRWFVRPNHQIAVQNFLGSLNTYDFLTLFWCGCRLWELPRYQFDRPYPANTRPSQAIEKSRIGSAADNLTHRKSL